MDRGTPQGRTEDGPKGRRKVAPRDGRGAARRAGRGGGRCPEKVARGTGRWLPWSRRPGPGRGLSDTAPPQVAAGRRGRGPEELDGFGRTVTRGCVASGSRGPPGRRALSPTRVGDSAPGAQSWTRARRAADLVDGARVVGRRRRSARTRARTSCGRCRRAGTSRGPARRSAWASSEGGMAGAGPGGPRGPATSLDRLHTCRSWTSPTPATPVIDRRRAARSTSAGVDSKQHVDAGPHQAHGLHHDEQGDHEGGRRVEAVPRRRR